MKLLTRRCEWSVVEPFRNNHREEMACQVLRDSLHRRPGWVEWYSLEVNGEPVGYGAIVVAGPWAGMRSLFELYLLPEHRSRLIEFGEMLVATANIGCLDTQTNDRVMMVLLHQLCDSPKPDKLVFQHRQKSNLPGFEAVFRRAVEADQSSIFKHSREPVGDWLLEFEGGIIATGGYLSHYNPPYVDIYLEVREDMRRRGFGSFMVQEICRVAEENKMIPCGRCDPDNIGSMKAMVCAGMAPCAHRVSARTKAEQRSA